jgi:hypothetical protein
MDKTRRAVLLFAAATGAAFLEGWLFNKVDAARPERFLREEKRLIEQYFRNTKKSKVKGLHQDSRNAAAIFLQDYRRSWTGMVNYLPDYRSDLSHCRTI